jgi:pyrroline-5-carboxylate reductase
VVIGGGKMGEALVSGLLAAGWAEPGEVVVVEASPARREELAAVVARHRGLVVSEAAVPGDGALLAVKPGDAEAVCRDLAVMRYPRLLSIAAGVTLASLERWVGAEGGTAVVRAMPNTPALVGAGAAAIAGGSGATDDDLEWAEGILAAVGTVVRVNEAQLDAVTGLSGSGPAYVYLVAEALIDAGVLVGLPRTVARALVTQTLLGAAMLLDQTGETPEALRAAVTSPGGTTAAGLRALEAGGVRATVLDAVVAATERAAQLGA